MDPVAIRLRWGNNYIGYMVFIVYVYVHFNFWMRGMWKCEEFSSLIFNLMLYPGMDNPFRGSFHWRFFNRNSHSIDIWIYRCTT